MATTALHPSALRRTVDPASLGFTDTRALAGEPLPWIGQPRAEAAARFGLRLEAPDYHLFVLGDEGSGRSTLLRDLMRTEAAGRPVPPDLCYLNNFEAPERPRALRLPAGEGRLLRQRMADLAKALEEGIPHRLTAPEVRAAAERIEAGFKAGHDQAFDTLSAYAEAHGFALLREQGRLMFTQRDEHGEPLTAEKALKLSREERAALDDAEETLRGEIGRFLDAEQQREQALAEALAKLRRQMVKPLLERELQALRGALRKQIKDAVKLGQYLAEVQHAVLENLELFLPLGRSAEGDDEDDSAAAAAEDARIDALTALLGQLRVNLVVDHHGHAAAPVIVDDHPTYRALFGSIEYAAENDVLVTDFSRIRAGSLLQAHGGFLMLHLSDLLADAFVWEKLRRFLRSGRLQIEEPGAGLGPIAAVSLRPEAVDVQVKLVLVASAEAYYAVQEADPEFARRFRCKVDFAERFAADAATHQATAVFIARTCEALGLPPVEAAAVARLIEASHRDAADQARQSACFGRLEALVLESAAGARARGAGCVAASDVDAALAARSARHDHLEEALQDAIADGERLLAFSGRAVGQLNGLTVTDPGDHAFGLPVRVTATTHAGQEGLLNIAREVALSGPIHDKGVLILQGHLSALFAHMAPLAMDASVVFEQQYGGVEGDSASCAEFCAILSALAGVPLAQGIAVTGALSQRGELLPVGGVNEKIEGFFRSCSRAGLDGTQGVLMPSRNRRHLMLAAEVVDAVAAGRFHLWTADTVGEAMALLTGLPYGRDDGADADAKAEADVFAGTPPPGGRYPAGTVLGRAQATLEAYRRACAAWLAPQAARGAGRASLGVGLPRAPRRLIGRRR